jgi:hypothetical protein
MRKAEGRPGRCFGVSFGAYATIPLLFLLSFASSPKEDFPLAYFAASFCINMRLLFINIGCPSVVARSV